VTAGNFWRAALIGVALSVLLIRYVSLNSTGVWYAIASGALTSGIGYAIWYTALPALRATQAASVQLSVPVIAAMGGIVFLGETLSLRLVFASAAILGGIALVIKKKNSS
jgi:drug/metabolite transporter (DMT)-like permease